MGSQQGKQSGNNYGNIFVITEKPYYLAGDNVTGHVYVNIINHYPGDCVFLKFKGLESSWWRESYQEHYTYTDSNGHSQSGTRTQYRYHQASNKFYNHKFCIHSWGQSLPPGQYAFPFSFLLNNMLPGTFLEESSDYKAVIKYKIKAEIIPHDKNVYKIKHHQVMVLHEPVKQMVQAQNQQSTTHLTTWCCIDQGIIDIKCHFESNTYQTGDNAIIIDEIDNSKSKLKIKNLEVILQQNLKLVSNSGIQKVFHRQVNKLNFLGLDAGQSRVGDNRQFHNLPLKDEKQSNLNPTTNGQYVNCQYTLKLRCVMEGCTCCSNDPFVEVPINLVQPPPYNFGQVEKPNNWNPQVFEVKNIAFNDNMIYQPRAQQPDQVQININQQQQFQPPPPNVMSDDPYMQQPLLQGQQQQFQPPR